MSISVVVYAAVHVAFFPPSLSLPPLRLAVPGERGTLASSPPLMMALTFLGRLLLLALKPGDQHTHTHRLTVVVPPDGGGASGELLLLLYHYTSDTRERGW